MSVIIIFIVVKKEIVFYTIVSHKYRIVYKVTQQILKILWKKCGQGSTIWN